MTKGLISCCSEDSCPVKKAMNDGAPYQTNLYLHHKNGHRLPVRVVTAPVKNPESKVIGAIEIFNDNSSTASLLDRVKKLQDMALLDGLTGLANRRFTEMQLNARLSAARRYGISFGILFIDVDHFKEINDQYGHDIGDQVLKMVANTLLKSSRSYDLIGRWGGEEFIVLIPYIDDKKCLYAIANKYRMLVAMSGFSHNKNKLRTTISIGGTICQKDDIVETLIKRTDELMYKSKISGRDQVTID